MPYDFSSDPDAPFILERLQHQLTRVETAVLGLYHRPDRAERVLITGGTGTLGRALTAAFLNADCRVTVLSRSAQHQAEYQERYPEVDCRLADICDYAHVRAACLGQDIVIHAAALKRVDTGETQISEFARVNITGTETVIRACHDALVDRALFISSDKAVSPLNYYGLTKALGERLWCAANSSHAPHLTRFAAVRYGNVMGSNGSVLQVWRKQCAQGQKILVREPETSRFFMTLTRAVELVTLALAHMQGGEIFVPSDTPAFWLYDLAREIAPENTWRREPLGPREKPHEILIAPGEYVEPCSANMVRVWPQRAGSQSVAPAFSSQTAPRLTGVEAAQLLGDAP